MSGLEVRRLGKAFGALRALDGVDLEAGPGEIVGVTGPSGAGKSTLCRIVAGLDSPTDGEVWIAGRPVTAVPVERRGVAFMFESYALYPHLTVFDNVAFPLRAPGAPPRSRAEVAGRVREVLRLVGLDELDRRRPGELSGGQRQRVALCRALVQEPRLFVLDEPIAHLDAKLRHVLRGAVRRRLRAAPVPTVWTSPDALEVIGVAERVVVLIEGRVHQIGPADHVYRRPATVEVARLLGDPPMNLLPGVIEDSGDRLQFRHVAFSLALPGSLRPRLDAIGRRELVILGVRPADIAVDGGSAGAVSGEVWVWEPFGKYSIVSVRLGPDIVKAKVAGRRSFRAREPVGLRLDAAEPALFDPRTGRAI
jgi:ABC-type sugar transport system ATPase subunit